MEICIFPSDCSDDDVHGLSYIHFYHLSPLTLAKSHGKQALILKDVDYYKSAFEVISF